MVKVTSAYRSQEAAGHDTAPILRTLGLNRTKNAHSSPLLTQMSVINDGMIKAIGVRRPIYLFAPLPERLQVCQGSVVRTWGNGDHGLSSMNCSI